MRLFSILAGLLLVAVILWGCGGQPIVHIVSEGEDIEVNVGQWFVIELSTNPTTGYDWEADYDGEMLKLEKREYVPTGEQIGSGGVVQFFFRAKKAGETTVDMEYKRVGDEQSPADEVQVFKVRIRG